MSAWLDRYFVEMANTPNNQNVFALNERPF
jgi:hypothetical protein